MRRIEQISPSLKSAYGEQYSDASTAWRELGAKYKSDNIERLCRGLDLKRVLDCGAGEGAMLQELGRRGLATKFHAVEISESGLAQIAKRDLPFLGEACLFDGYNLPYEDGYFDLVYCTHVLEHVEHPRILLREIKRVSRYQVFEVPLDFYPNVDRDTDHFLSYGHINVFTPSTFRFLLKSEGFEIKAQHLSRIADEMRNFGQEKSLRPGPAAVPLHRRMKKALGDLLLGSRKAPNEDEFGYDAFTCLTEEVGELRIFSPATDEGKLGA